MLFGWGRILLTDTQIRILIMQLPVLFVQVAMLVLATSVCSRGAMSLSLDQAMDKMEDHEYCQLGESCSLTAEGEQACLFTMSMPFPCKPAAFGASRNVNVTATLEIAVPLDACDFIQPMKPNAIALVKR